MCCTCRKGISNRDLKAENVLLAWNAASKAEVIKLCDFGCVLHFLHSRLPAAECWSRPCGARSLLHLHLSLCTERPWPPLRCRVH